MKICRMHDLYLTSAPSLMKLYRFSTPRRDGMVLISHHPFDTEDTRQFNNFTQDDYERYQETNKNQDDRVAAWFRITNDQPIVVNLGERSGRYILVKLFPAEHETASLDLQYIALLGYIGARSFVKAQLF
ncbi:hypothetical protein BCR42DRAFT_34623 [Absidia repens]|uniref:Uncharacterized protein n=1 Tax=Absidia repens TaxID=90262 RepID=A0A1X2IGU4_9FUNG|nr:hypothetical protein BCR42DRAFT_34623 [Absidia repens]